MFLAENALPRDATRTSRDKLAHSSFGRRRVRATNVDIAEYVSGSRLTHVVERLVKVARILSTISLKCLTEQRSGEDNN